MNCASAYANIPLDALHPPTDPRKTIVPDLASLWYGKNALATFRAPKTFVLMINGIVSLKTNLFTNRILLM